MIYDIGELIPLQKALDEDIASRHNLSYASTSNRRLLALFVEIGEFANSTRTFKFWSTKGPEIRERVLDEAADCLHFFLSKFIENNVEKCIFDINPKDADEIELTDLFLNIYSNLSEFGKLNDNKYLLEAFSSYLQVVRKLGFSNVDLVYGYKLKLKVKYNRQKTNY